MKFVFNVEKLKSHQIGLVRAHNLREGKKDRMSQVDKNAWFSKSERLEIVPWNQERLNEARALSKRKDAVEAISFIIQVGNQADWREPSTAECPAGRPRNPPPADPLKMAEAAKKWAEAEFGKENVVSIELHLDESTPHLHLVVTPIFDKKLQATKWLNGPRSIAVLRSSIHKHVNAAIPCSYEPGRAGGEPHDVGKAAGRVRSENVAPTVPCVGLIARLSGGVERDNAQLVDENLRLQSEHQRLLDVIATLRVGKNGGLLAIKADTEKLKEQLDSRTKLLLELKTQLETARVSAEKQKAHDKIQRSEIDSLRKELVESAELAKKLGATQLELDGVISSQKRMKADYGKLKEVNLSLSSQLNPLLSQHQKLQTAFEVQREELDGLRKKHAPMIELEQKIEVLEQKNAALEVSHQRSLTQIVELHDEIGRQHDAYMQLLNKRESSKDAGLEL